MSNITQENFRIPQTPDITETREGLIIKFETGLMAGSERFIELTSFTIGSGTQTDVILLDNGIQNEHLTVNISRSLLGMSVAIHALESDVIVSGTPLEINTTVTRQNDIEVNLAGINLKFFDARGYKYNNNTSTIENAEQIKLDKDTSPPQPSFENLPALLSAVALIFIGLAIFIFSSDTNDTGTETTITNAVKKSDNDSKTFLLTLRNKVDKVGLAPYISIKTGTNNTLKVTGELQQTHSRKWREILQWYDTQESPPPLFNQVIELSDQSDLPEIKLVNFGTQKYALLGNNRRAFIGETIDKGWKIDRVDDKGILVSKANQKILVQFK